MAEKNLSNLKKRYLRKGERALVRSVPRLSADDGASGALRGGTGWMKRISFLMIVFFLSFVLMVIGGVVSPKFRSVFFRAADVFSGQAQPEHAAAPDSILTGSPFTDVAGSDPAARALLYLKNKGVLTGYPDGTFRPAETLTRAALISLIGKINNSNPHPYLNSYCFKDVGGEWYSRYVCAAKRNGWITGYNGNLFKPESEISRAEAIKIVMTVFGGSDVRVSDRAPGKENSTMEVQWYQPYLDFARDKNWLWQGFDENRINDPMTRGEAAQMLYRIISSGGALK